MVASSVVWPTDLQVQHEEAKMRRMPRQKRGSAGGVSVLFRMWFCCFNIKAVSEACFGTWKSVVESYIGVVLSMGRGIIINISHRSLHSIFRRISEDNWNLPIMFFPKAKSLWQYQHWRFPWLCVRSLPWYDPNVQDLKASTQHHQQRCWHSCEPTVSPSVWQIIQDIK